MDLNLKKDSLCFQTKTNVKFLNYKIQWLPISDLISVFSKARSARQKGCSQHAAIWVLLRQHLKIRAVIGQYRSVWLYL